MSKLVKKNGKLLKKDGKFIKTDDPAKCPCCGGDCDGTCNPDFNPLTRCASAALTCFQNDCDPEPGFPECIDYIKPEYPDNGSLKALLKVQGYEVVIDDSQTHPTGCCDCEGINHFTIWGCCTGVISRDEDAVRTALQKPGAPCENCTPRGDGIEPGVDKDGNPVWRVYQCRPGGPPCTDAGCCHYEEVIGVVAEAVSPGWTVTPFGGGGSTLFRKPVRCDGPEVELFTWREVGNPANEQTYPAYLTPGGFCCNDQCQLDPCDPCENCPAEKVCTFLPPDCGPGECCVAGVFESVEEAQQATEGFPYDALSKSACDAWIESHPNAPCPEASRNNPLP